MRPQAAVRRFVVRASGRRALPLLEARREQVLDAAEIVLAEVGVTATMDEIAEAAGIGRRTLFRYFPSREDLIAAAIERRYQRLDREVFDDAHLAADDPDETHPAGADHDPPRAAQMGKAHWQVAADREVLNRLGAAAAAAPAGSASLRAAFHRTLWELAGDRRHRRPGSPARSGSWRASSPIRHCGWTSGGTRPTSRTSRAAS